MTPFEISYLQQQALMLMQAMLGGISPNFTMISISIIEEKIKIKVVLGSESKEDREELEDCQTQFDSFQSGPIDYDFDIVVDDGDITLWSKDNTIYIYRKREN